MMLAYVDLDALPGELDGLPLWSARRRSWIRYRPSDFLDGLAAPLAPRVRDRTEALLGWRPLGPVHLMSHLRTGGWLFNPLSLYYHWSQSGELEAILAEVSNTPWHERHWYAIDVRTGRTNDAGSGRPTAREADHQVTPPPRPPGSAEAPKSFHVSPYLPMDLTYHFSWVPPGDEFGFTVAARREGRPAFTAHVTGVKEPLLPATSARLALRHPWQPLVVSAGIYAHAGVLALRGAKYQPHPNKSQVVAKSQPGEAEQRNLHSPVELQEHGQ